MPIVPLMPSVPLYIPPIADMSTDTDDDGLPTPPRSSVFTTPRGLLQDHEGVSGGRGGEQGSVRGRGSKGSRGQSPRGRKQQRHGTQVLSRQSQGLLY